MIESQIKSIKSISSVIIANEALKHGIMVDHINACQKQTAFLELSYKGHLEYFFVQKSSQITATADYATINKALSKSLIGRAGISVVEGKLFNRKNIHEIYKYVKKISYPIVLKKMDGNQGKQVFVGIKNKKMCDIAIRDILKENEYVLVEKNFEGKEYRILATKDKFLAATHREPANVIGDGIHNIRELVKIKNNDSMRGDSSLDIFVKIKIDDIAKNMIASEGLKLQDILSEGRKVYLRKNSNISTGGDNIDVTNLIHAEFKRIAVKTICAIPGLPYGGIDLMTNRSISLKPTKKSYAILEINSSPGISLHHYPYKGKSRNVAKEIISMLFPEINK